MALRWSDVDLGARTRLVARSFDAGHGPGATRTGIGGRPGRAAAARAPGRRAPRQPPARELCFGIGGGQPFRPNRFQERADEAGRDAGLERLTLHDCRHTFASLSIAAGANAKTLSTCMGHASVAITLDRYGHLMPGNEAEAADLLDTYLASTAR